MENETTSGQPDHGCTHEELAKFLHDYTKWYAKFTAAQADPALESSDPPGPPPPPPGPRP